MKNQYEQQCNGLALKRMGVTRIKRIRKGSLNKIEKWLFEEKPLNISFPDIVAKAVERAIQGSV